MPDSLTKDLEVASYPICQCEGGECWGSEDANSNHHRCRKEQVEPLPSNPRNDLVQRLREAGKAMDVLPTGQRVRSLETQAADEIERLTRITLEAQAHAIDMGNKALALAACNCPEVCKVCGGRAAACALVGHRSEGDRAVKWHECPSVSEGPRT